MKLSNDGRLLSCLLSNNIICILDVSSNPVECLFFLALFSKINRVYLVSDSANANLNQMKFSLDSCSQLTTLDLNGQVRNFLLSGNPSTKMGPISWIVRFFI